MNLIRKISSLVLAIALPLIWFGTLRIYSFGNAENSLDCYYHVGMADMGPTVYMRKQFPFTTMSIWKDQFSDKELGFHIILTGIRQWQRLLGLDMKPPFHFPAMIMICIMLGAFVFACQQFKCGPPVFFSMLLVCISPLFCFRVLMLRPQVLSISLMLLSAVFYHKTNGGKTLFYPFIIGFVFSWCYSNPHFVLLPAVAFALIKSRNSLRTALLLPFLTLIGLVAGFTLHPQFPYTFLNWKIQSVDVVLQSLHRNPEYLGVELSPPALKMIGFNFLTYVLYAINTYLVLKKFKSERLHNVGPAEALYIVSTISMIGFFVAQRAIEYACPFNVLCFATLLNHPFYAESGLLSLKTLRQSIMPVSILIIILSTSMWLFLSKQDTPSYEPLNEFSEWAKTSDITDRTIIANPFWSDFPLLFYSAPQFYYLSGLDPMFSFFRYPEKMKQIEDFRTGKAMLSPGELHQLTGARFAFVSVYGKVLAQAMHMRGYHMIYHGYDGWLFSLPE